MAVSSEAGEADETNENPLPLAAQQRTSSAGGPSLSFADEIAKLKALRDQGALSEEEFAAFKAKLL